MTALRDMTVLVLDCQASGATPAYGDLLALGWAFSNAQGLTSLRDHWIRPRTERSVSRAVRELTGWSEAHLVSAQDDAAVWQLLRSELQAQLGELTLIPTVIHFARFELTFLRELHGRLEPTGEFPFDACCLHAIGARLYPDLPRRNIRALAGFLGHTTDLTRHVAGHVEASAFIWRALIPQLEEQGVTTWSELQAWLAQAPKTTRSKRRVYPLSVERRRELPDRPGVYRFVRKNESILYVGKAASLKKRIAGHFSSRGPNTERGLELLSQVHAIRYTETPSILEAALLETDEIKRIDPPYNVQLRSAERQAWFATRDFRRASATPDREYAVGPLPSESALIGLGAWRMLLTQLREPSSMPAPGLCAMALAVPTAFLPPPALFCEGFHVCVRELFAQSSWPTSQRVSRAARALWIARGRNEPEKSAEDAPPDQWDLARVRRRLERTLVNGGLVLRRARLLRLLADCTLGYREKTMKQGRALVIERADIVERFDVVLEDAPLSLAHLPARPVLSLAERRSCFDAASYDRLRVLVTEIRRVEQEGGELALRVGRHHWPHARVLALLQGV